MTAGLDEIDDFHEDESTVQMHKVINLQILYYIASTFSFIINILDKYGDVTDIENHYENLQKILQRDTQLFHWFYSKCKWIVTPFTFDAFLSLPYCLISLLHRNKEKNVKVCLKHVLD